MIAALYVAEGGVYSGLSDVEIWPESRDARLYAGPWPVVAHPPCQRWGRYWSGGPSAKEAASGQKDFRLLSKVERLSTPLPFRDLLLSIARTAKPTTEQEAQ